MSVFSKHRQWVASTNEQKPENGETLCKGGHRWNGVLPYVNPNLHQIQNPEFIGKRCDCGHLLYVTEDICGCPSDKYWRIYYE